MDGSRINNTATAQKTRDEFARSAFASSLYQAGTSPQQNTTSYNSSITRENENLKASTPVSWGSESLSSSLPSMRAKSGLPDSLLRQSGFFNATASPVGYTLKARSGGVISPSLTSKGSLSAKGIVTGPTGSWQHPSLQAVRQNRALINQEFAVTKLVYNIIYWLVLRLIMLVMAIPGLSLENWRLSNLLHRLFGFESHNASYYTSMGLLALQALFAFNIVISIYKLTQTGESGAYLASLQLTPEQRSLLGLPASTVGTSVHTDSVDTPPKYLKSSTPGVAADMKSEKSDVGPVSNTPSSSELGRPLVGSVPIVPPKVNKSQNTTSSTILAPKGLEMKAATTPSPKSSFVPCGKYLYMSDSTSSISRRG